MFWCAAGFSLLVCCPERKGAESRCYEIYTSRPAQPPPPPRQARVSAQLRSGNAGTAAPRRSARGRGPQSGGGTRARQGSDANTRLRLQSARTRPRRLLSGGHNKGQSAHSQGPEEAGSGGASERSFSRREPRAPHSPSAAARLPPAARPAGPAPPPGAPPPRPLPRRGRPTNRARARRGVSWRSASNASERFLGPRGEAGTAPRPLVGCAAWGRGLHHNNYVGLGAALPSAPAHLLRPCSWLRCCTSYLELYVAGKKYTSRAIGERGGPGRVAATACPPDTSTRPHCEVLLRDPSAVLSVPDLAERCGAWHSEDPESVC